MRDLEVDEPVPGSFVKDLRELSFADTVDNPSFAFAHIAVLSNFERHKLNRMQAEAFAKAHKLPFVMWKMELVGRQFESMTDGQLKELFENEPGLWGYFVRGAPAMLTQNIQPTKILANGSMGFMHSLTFQGEAS